MKRMIIAAAVLLSLITSGHLQAKSTINIVITDHLGTPQQLVDQNQEVVWKASYAPFGKATIDVQKVFFNQRFPGQYYDKETGAHYNYHRDYSPELGRYLQSDPIGLAGGINTYAYAGSNPVINIDPNGLNYYRYLTPQGFRYIGKMCEAAFKAIVGAITITSVIEEASDDADSCDDCEEVPVWVPEESSYSDSMSNQRPDGAWPADKGAREWDKRNGGGRNGRDKFHDSKQGSHASGGKDDWSVNPDTGDVYDPNGEWWDNLND